MQTGSVPAPRLVRQYLTMRRPETAVFGAVAEDGEAPGALAPRHNAPSAAISAIAHAAAASAIGLLKLDGGGRLIRIADCMPTVGT